MRNVGGERVELATLVGPNGDVHVYAPTPGDVKTIAAANIVFVNGLGLEGWIDRLIAASASRAPVVVASRGIGPRSDTREDLLLCARMMHDFRDAAKENGAP